MKNDFLSIFSLTLRKRIRSIAVYSIIGVGLTALYVGMFPSIAEKSEDFNKILEQYPESMKSFFGVDQLNFSHLENFLALENYSITWPMIAILLVLAFAGIAIAGEIEKGTIELILSRPISRRAFFLGRYLSGASALAIFTAISVFSVFPFAALADVSVVPAAHLKIALSGFLFGLTIFSLGMLFSALFSERSRVYLYCGLIVGVMYVLNAAANLLDQLNFLKYFSLFYYFDGVNVLMKNHLDPSSILVLIIFSIAAAVLAAKLFEKRDIAV